MTKLAVFHVERPMLPWRKPEANITECGHPVAEIQTIDRLEFKKRLREWGKQRTAMTVCITCMETAQRWREWGDDPLDAVARESGKFTYQRREADLFRNELLALEQLYRAHTEEFETLMAQAEWRRQKRGGA